MKVIGHRGWPLKYPENTLASFAGALALGVDALECDIHLTRDDRLVIIHDRTLMRTTDGIGMVHRLTLEELKRFDAGRWFNARFAGERIPTLEELLDLVAGRAALFIEVKNPGRSVRRLNRALTPLLDGYTGDVVIHSFDARYLRAFRRERPDVKTGFLCHASAETIAETVDMGCAAIHPQWHTITPQLNEAIREAALGIMTWTAADRADCKAIRDTLDVDWVGCDCPDVMMEVLGRKADTPGKAL